MPIASVKTRLYRFSAETTDGEETMKTLLGGKGAGLAEMTRLGISCSESYTHHVPEAVGSDPQWSLQRYGRL
jgi:hypothetical protein